MGYPRAPRVRRPGARDALELKLIIPYVPGGLAPEVRELGLKHGAMFADVSADDQAYWRLLAMLWREGEAFCIVEQDLLPDDELLEEVWACAEPYCAFVYVYDFASLEGPRVLGVSWGLSGRYSSALIRRYPDALDELSSAAAAQWNGPRYHPRHWTRVGVALSDHVLIRRGEQPHMHLRPARHLRLENVQTRVLMREPSQPREPGKKRGWIYVEGETPISRRQAPVETSAR